MECTAVLGIMGTAQGSDKLEELQAKLGLGSSTILVDGPCATGKGDMEGLRWVFCWPSQDLAATCFPAGVCLCAAVAVTQVFGQPRGLLVDQFDSKEDLINALCTSSFIPGCVGALSNEAHVFVRSSQGAVRGREARKRQRLRCCLCTPRVQRQQASPSPRRAALSFAPCDYPSPQGRALSCAPCDHPSLQGRALSPMRWGP